MSWARFSADSDVYVYEDVAGYINCCGCSLEDPRETNFTEAAPLKAHLDRHVAAGHKVPARVWVNFDTFAADPVAFLAPNEDGS